MNFLAGAGPCEARPEFQAPSGAPSQAPAAASESVTEVIFRHSMAKVNRQLRLCFPQKGETQCDQNPLP